MKTKLLSALCAVMILCSCGKETAVLTINNTSWEVVSVGGMPSTTAYVVSFSDKSYSLSLDENKCNGGFVTPQYGTINISSLGCTKVCCDSDFGQNLSNLFIQVTSYSINGDMLYLNPGNIVLRRE